MVAACGAANELTNQRSTSLARVQISCRACALRICVSVSVSCSAPFESSERTRMSRVGFRLRCTSTRNRARGFDIFMVSCELAGANVTFSDLGGGGGAGLAALS